MSAIERAIKEANGPIELARRTGVKYQVVQYWRKTGVARPRYWALIEKATEGRVTQTELLADAQGR